MREWREVAATWRGGVAGTPRGEVLSPRRNGARVGPRDPPIGLASPRPTGCTLGF